MQPFKHRTLVQIRFKDIDALGHVNNANHLSYFELARMNYSDDVLGPIDWSKTGFILASARIDYKLPIMLKDKLFVLSRVTKMGTKSFEIEHLIVRIESDGTETTLASGASVLVCMNYANMKTIPIPDEWKKKVFEFDGVKATA